MLFGLCPIPIQGPHALSSILAPAFIISDNAPLSASILRTCFEPGAIQSETLGSTVLPLRIEATFIISTKEEFVHEPIATWSTLIFPISSVVLTLSGIWGQAAMGTSEQRSMSITSSYSASASAESSTQSFSLPCALRNARVISSDGKIDVVAPSSAPIFVIVARSGTDKVFTPSPPYSIILPTPPLTLIMRRTSKITSFAETHGFK